MLPSLPTPLGLAGAFVGVSGGLLMVAGGANFPDKPPWEGGVKQWHNQVYALAMPHGAWKSVGMLARPRAYGVSASWRGRVLCVGGSDATQHHSTTFAIRYRATSGVRRDSIALTGQRIDIEMGPEHPERLANAAGVLVDDALYVAGGSSSPAAQEASQALWKLDLSSGLATATWTVLPSMPGPGRVLPALAWMPTPLGGELLVVSGARLLPSAEGATTPSRSFLRDAFAFEPGTRMWRPLAPPPRPLVASPGPGIDLGQFRTQNHDQSDGHRPLLGSGVLFLPGDDGEHFFEQATLREKHPGFPRKLLRYTPAEGSWAEVGSLPNEAAVTTTLTRWQGMIVVPSGEIRPGVRTPRVQALMIE